MATVGLDVIRKLKSYEAGKPLPLGDSLTIYVAEPDHLAAVAYVRMGGEARPWAIGFQRESDPEPEVWSASDGRRASEVEDGLVEFAGRLGLFLGSPVFGGTGNNADIVRASPLNQVWLPNGSHLDMLHMLNLRHALAKRTARGEEDGSDLEALKGLGRACGYMFRESGCSTEVGVVDASRALRSAYTFPVDDLRAAHLGLLIALTTPDLDLEALGKVAEEAEALSVSTTLDPVLERDRLEPLIGGGTDENREGIAAILREEIVRRLELTLTAAQLLRQDERAVNVGVEEMVNASKESRWWEYLRTETTIAGGDFFLPPSPETDGKRVAAARRYTRMAGADERREGLLMAHDSALVDEAVAAGDAIRGELTEIELRVPAGKKQRAIFWELVLPANALVRVKAPRKVTAFDLEVPDGQFTELVKKDGVTVAVIRMIRQSTILSADDESLKGRTVTLVPLPVDFTQQRGKALSRQPGPGHWLTHGEGGRPLAAEGVKRDGLLDEVERLRK